MRAIKRLQAWLLYQRALNKYNDAIFYKRLAEECASDALDLERAHTITRMEIEHESTAVV